MIPAALGVVLFAFQVKEGTLDHPLVPVYSLCIALWSMLFLVRAALGTRWWWWW